MKTVRFAAVALLLFTAPAFADVTTTVVDLTPAPGIRQRILEIRPDAPVASIVALPGGNGVLNITDSGTLSNTAGRCFPFNRTRGALAAQGFALALVDVASDGSTYEFRNVSEVVRYMRQKADVPVWIAGGSASTNPAADIASSLGANIPVGAIFFSTDIPDTTLAARVRRPALVVFNTLDTGQDAVDFYAALTAASPKQLVALSGGTDSGCGYHLYQGIEDQFAATVSNFILANNGATLVAPAFEMDQHGLTGSWYQPATSGQGVEIEVYKDLVASGTGFLQGSWFTFDHAASGGADHGRWYTFGGNVQTGSDFATLPLYQNVGGNFNAPPATSAKQVGTVTLSFSDCVTARMSYAFTDASGRNGSVDLTRLTANLTCAPSGSGINADFALSGNWFDPAKPGQGFMFEVNPGANAIFFAWYTYAPDGQALGAAGQRWYTGQAGYTPGARTIALSLYETTGGMFNTAQPQPQTAAVGTATIVFASCSAAHLTFNFTAGSNAGQGGSIDLSRVGPVPAGCSP